MTIQTHEQYKNFHVATHPLIQHKISLLRDVTTDKKMFKELVDELTLLLVYEATKALPMTTRRIQTPLETFDAPVLASDKPVIIPILRAGIGMVDAFLSLMPNAHVGHIGLFRDETTLKPQQYYFKIPKDTAKSQVFVCDPMLATGGSVVATINLLKENKIKDITFVCLVAAPEGIKKLCETHPDVPVYAASIDRELSDKGYILPGLGDAGDRLFGTQ